MFPSCLQPICDASWVHGDTVWLEQLSDNYTAAVFVYYNSGNKEIAIKSFAMLNNIVYALASLCINHTTHVVTLA